MNVSGIEGNNLDLDTACGGGVCASSTIFMDPTAGDFRLRSDSPVADQGADLSADPDLPFDYDIDKHLRPFGSDWDIGADEYGGYYATGTFTSQIKDTGGNFAYGTTTWSETLPASTTIYVKVRTSDSATMVGAPDWDTCNPVWNGTDISNNNCVIDSDQYFQYRVEMETEVLDRTPVFSDIKVEYEKHYDGYRNFYSSVYDSESAENIIAGISWDETLATGSEVYFTLRAASSAADVFSNPWNTVAESRAGYLTPGCTKTGNHVACDISVIPAALKDGSEDQFVEYIITINTTNYSYTPAISNVTVIYAVNAPPEFNPAYGPSGEGITAYQIPTSTDPDFGQVKIGYSIKDIDTTTGNITQDYITPSFEYSLNDGLSWNTVATTALSYLAASSSGESLTLIATANWTTKYLKKIICSTTLTGTRPARFPAVIPPAPRSD